MEIMLEKTKRGRRALVPRLIAPQLATLSADIPRSKNWLFEEKFDGYRILARIENGKIHLISRNGLDWTGKFPALRDELEKRFPGETLYLDGEVIAESPGAGSSFQSLQNYFRLPEKTKISYRIFDFLWFGKHDLRQLPLRERKRFLKKLLGRNSGLVRYTEHLQKNPERFFRSQCARKQEGMICKNAESPYVSGRTRNWLKVKCSGNDEFIIVGFTKLTKNERAVGALLLARYRGNKLVYCGKVGTGFSASLRVELFKGLSLLIEPKCPLSSKPRVQGAFWVRPKLVAQISYTERTSQGHIRHPSFSGIRKDKKASEVRDEIA